ncbi:MAG: hypothetical protein LBT76_01680 [Tannerella sp.]|jgi:hypothetical protein|nr:hypothetical protein [Tannerella sp.]
MIAAAKTQNNYELIMKNDEMQEYTQSSVCHTVTGILKGTPRPVLANAVKQSSGIIFRFASYLAMTAPFYAGSPVLTNGIRATPFMAAAPAKRMNNDEMQE